MKAVLFDTEQEAFNYSRDAFPRHDGVTQCKWPVKQHYDQWAVLVDDTVEGAIDIQLESGEV